MRPCSLLSLATAVPPHVDRAKRSQGSAREKRSADARPCSTGWRACSTMPGSPSGTSSRRTTGTWRSHGWHDRNTLYLEASEALFAEAASAAIEKAGLTPDQIDGVVTVSTTGIATPSLEARVGPRIGLARRRPPGAGVRPRLRRRGQRPCRWRPGWRPPSREATGCSSPSKPARSRSASTATTRRRWSRPPCSATAPPRRW